MFTTRIFGIEHDRKIYQSLKIIDSLYASLNFDKNIGNNNICLEVSNPSNLIRLLHWTFYYPISLILLLDFMPSSQFMFSALINNVALLLTGLAKHDSNLDVELRAEFFTAWTISALKEDLGSG